MLMVAYIKKRGQNQGHTDRSQTSLNKSYSVGLILEHSYKTKLTWKKNPKNKK